MFLWQTVLWASGVLFLWQTLLWVSGYPAWTPTRLLGLCWVGEKQEDGNLAKIRSAGLLWIADPHFKLTDTPLAKFCGQVFVSKHSQDLPYDDFVCEGIEVKSMIYFCGDVQQHFQHLKAFSKYKIIREYSTSLPKDETNIISYKNVPVIVGKDSGVFIPECFDTTQDYFQRFGAAHNYQSLTESNKGNKSYRDGLYLSSVFQNENGGLHFDLLRCSTNFQGPTENLRDVDREILDVTNIMLSKLWTNSHVVNHVLAQRYNNVKTTNGGQKKAKIPAHSDKSKDFNQCDIDQNMICFATFYSRAPSDPPVSPRRLSTAGHLQAEYALLAALPDESAARPLPALYEKEEKKNKKEEKKLETKKTKTSVFTKLRFRVKKVVPMTWREWVEHLFVPIEQAPSHLESFDVTLTPHSLLMINQATNRFFTHEIMPSPLEIQHLPTRLGYVMRTSGTRAVYEDGKTWIFDKNNKKQLLMPPTEKDQHALKTLYRMENTRVKQVDYPPIYFSMNQGDYQAPIV